MSEGLNNIKKEMQALSFAVEAQDPQWTEFSLQKANFLGQILGKTEREMFLHMQRVCINKKKKSAQDKMTKTVNMLKSTVEKDIKAQNKKNENDAFDIKDIDLSTL